MYLLLTKSLKIFISFSSGSQGRGTCVTLAEDSPQETKCIPKTSTTTCAR